MSELILENMDLIKRQTFKIIYFINNFQKKDDIWNHLSVPDADGESQEAGTRLKELQSSSQGTTDTSWDEEIKYAQ